MDKWKPTSHSQICSEHFVSGDLNCILLMYVHVSFANIEKQSRNPKDIDYIPSKFCFTQKRTNIMSARFRRATNRHPKVSQVYLVYKHLGLI